VTPCFVDTNILVYAVESGNDPRSRAARELVQDLLDQGTLRTSTQVLQELYVTLTRKIKPPMSAADAAAYVDSWSEWPVVVPGMEDVRNAMRLSESARISYWDALVVICARLAECTKLYTEDLNHGQKVLGISIVNQFR
jgi:predicted nucleic acid-binding protein